MKINNMFSVFGIVYSLVYFVPTTLSLLGYDFESNDIDLVIALLLFVYSEVVGD